MVVALTCGDDAFRSLCEWMDGYDRSGIVGPVVQRVLGPIAVFLIVFLVGRFVRNFLERTINRAGGDAQVRTLVHNVVTAVTVIFALISALIEAGLNPSFLLTFGGVSTLAVGLAFQDLLRNVLAGIFILVEQPFRIGDHINVNDVDGTVQTIKLRTTALKTMDGRLAILPNLTAFNSTVLNSSAYEQRMYTIAVHVDEDTEVRTTLTRLRREVAATKSIAKQPEPMLVPQLAADGGRSILVKVWLDYRQVDPDEAIGELTGRIWKPVAGKA
ncbi:MAG: mechanosensitive ion channel family protein [Candidatus Dormibacteria bacterium]